ncbi:MAG: Na+/H+ antiporter NhaC [Spongiibacter sp.]|uniref:Na+/H+ antiporter NhaC n=1 Tax=Spongiibacter sp. TaxID=2024860 RepID=UPI000C08E79F|nr:Na+/H+ antiporter NhaC [Spongiibacter sp.]MAK42889.1 Na+/H+ antiporter NhaC [Spongiibacter sp.]|tara:strand:+ start:90 stop:1514 length:1425 start_codon:yes stop_codon:yes gene_type:complete
MTPVRANHVGIALLPLCLVIGLLGLNVYLYGDAGIEGPNQLALLLGGGVAAVIGLHRGRSWQTLQDGMLKVIGVAIIPILMLFMIGALSSTWTVAGIVPTLIYYGLQLADPSWFYAAAAIVCAIVSTAIGSSWTTAATIGIAMMATGVGLGMSEAITAGAVISGAYFGDKLSPLSDTTNLAAGVCNVELFSHVRYLALTTLPSFAIALLIFVGLGIHHSSGREVAETQAILNALNTSMTLSGWLLLAPLLVVVMIVKRVPALPVMFIATLIGTVISAYVQPELVYQIGGERSASGLYKGLVQTIVGSSEIITGHSFSDTLLASSGMAGMLNTIWLILSAVVFGGMMEASGLLGDITSGLKRLARSRTSLVATTAGSCGVLNLTAAEQYLTILIGGRMYGDMYAQQGLSQRNLSRTLEDAGTATSVLVPWNTCGAFHATALGVATLSYLPFCFFNLISPFMSMLYMRFNIAIEET